MNAAPPPFVTIALPCLNEEADIEACLRGARTQDYPRDRVEIMVADGGSTDGTRAIIERIVAEDPRVSLVENPGRFQSAGMNEVIRRSRGDVIVRMDVHAEYAPDYVRKSVEVLERTGADNVGGAGRARGRTPFQRALCAALSSPLGVGGSKYRSAENEGFVESVWNGGFRRSVFERAGLYDPRAMTNEDAELNQRIHDAGGRVYLSREIVVHYFPRDGARKLAIQYYRYGRGRARTLLKHRRLPSVRPLIPFAMVVSGALLLATSHLHGLTPLALGAYAALTGAEAIRVAHPLGARAVATAWAIFPILHVSHGAPSGGDADRRARQGRLTGSSGGEARRGARMMPSGEGTSHGVNWKVQVAKRALDVVAATVGLALSAVLIPFIALAIKLDSRGPVLYWQRRAGALKGVERREGRLYLHFEEFDMPKFRTMGVDAEKGTGAVIAQRADPRVTRVGRFLRRTRLDEIPQLWSILRGHMSLVGPRPERPRLLRDLAFAIPFFEERMRGVKPGLTGFAQINLGYSGDALPGTDIAQLQEALVNPFDVDGAEGAVADDMRLKLLYDMAYSAALDDLGNYVRTEAEIILKTPVVMLRGIGR